MYTCNSMQGNLRLFRFCAVQTRTQTQRRNAHMEFFNSDGRLARDFATAQAAHATIRILLYEKDERGEHNNQIAWLEHNLASEG